MADYDAIVVGGGHNGLIAAAYLAKGGMNTLLLEARSSVGGCASTVEDLGARFNICNCDHTAIRGTPVGDELKLGKHGLEYLDVDPCMIAATWKGCTPWALFKDPDETLDLLCELYPAEVDGYKRYLKDAMPVAELIVELSSQVPTPANVAKTTLAKRGRGVKTLLSWSRHTAVEVLDRYFDHRALKLPAISTGPMVWGCCGNTPNTGLAALGYAMRHQLPVGRPVGGSGGLPKATASAFEAAGGTIQTGARVCKLICAADSVKGVELSDGTTIEAPVVVSACDPKLTFVEWLDEAPAAAEEVVKRWRDKPDADGYESKIDGLITELPRLRVLDETPAGEAFAKRGIDVNAATTVVSPGASEISEALKAMADGKVTENPMFFLNTPTVVDPSLKPDDNTHVLSLEVLYTPYEVNGGWDGSAEPQRWLDLFQTLVQPGWLDSLGDWRTMTPPRYESEFNMRRGHAVSFVGTPMTALLGKDPELTRYTTPVKGLYQTGAATYPGAGIWGSSGRNAAGVVLANQ